MIDFAADYRIMEFRTKVTSTNKTMADLKVENIDTKEILNCVLWQEELNNTDKKTLKTGNLISIVDGKYNEPYKNYVLKKIKLVKEAKSGLDKDQRDALFAKIIATVNDFKNPELKTAVAKIITENEHKFKIAPAAKNNHHNYIGGLMQHIYECIEIAKANFEAIRQPVDKELIIAACVTHDIGKVFEYTIDEETGMADIDESFKKIWISHIHFGFAWANNNGFHQLARIIASHHSRKDWGALIDLNDRDIEPVLYFMHHIDDLSAKFGAMKVEDLENLKI